VLPSPECAKFHSRAAGEPSGKQNTFGWRRVKRGAHSRRSLTLSPQAVVNRKVSVGAKSPRSHQPPNPASSRRRQGRAIPALRLPQSNLTAAARLTPTVSRFTKH